MVFRLEKMSCQSLRKVLLPLLCIMVLGLPACSPSSASSSEGLSKYTEEYDEHFISATGRFLPQYRWRWLKAQCYQESLLSPRAVSSAGAMGLCQFMPRTWDEVSKSLRLNASPFNPRANAIAAGYYMGSLDRQWTVPRPAVERLKLAQASYNAGLGNILKAQKKCSNALLWRDIEPCLGYKETRIYIEKIEFYYHDMEGNHQ